MVKVSSPALLAFNIGPVQEYIIAARRSQDLYVGSVLLSQMMEHACQAADWDHILYPHKPDPDKVAAYRYAPLPNRFIARYETAADAAAGAKRAEAAARAYWRDTVAAQVQKEIARRLGPAPENWADAWGDQVDNYLDITWVVVPLADSDTYDLTPAWAALEARRRLHAFAPFKPQYGYKCTIFSGLSAMGPGHTEASQSFAELRAFWQGLARTVATGTDDLPIVLRPDGRERLSALACMKRFAPFLGDPRLKLDVPSTSSIAASSYKAVLLQRLATGDEQLAALLVDYLDALRAIQDNDGRLIRQLAGDNRATPYLYALAQEVPGNERCKKVLLRYDGDLFFAETLTANRLYGDYGLQVTDGPSTDTSRAQWRDIYNELQTAREALHALVGYSTRTLSIAPPARYYAVLMMDGDHMGELFRGITDPTLHQTVSRRLSRFAAETVREIIEQQHPGKLIYAGGDDVLALLPLADALPVARRLQEAYHTAMAGLVPTAPHPTASVGIALAHQQAALDHVLAEARAAEKAAKRDFKRNAICIHALKRSGAPLRIGLHYADPGQPAALNPLAAVQLLIEAGVPSPRFAYAFAREAHAYADGLNLGPMVEATLYRLLGRQSTPESLWAFWMADDKEPATEVCRLLGLGDYAALNQQMPQASKKDQAHWLAPRIYKPLAEQLAGLATGLQAQTLQAVAQAARADRKWPPCPPQQKKKEPPEPPVTGAPALADWLLLLAFLTRGGAE